MARFPPSESLERRGVVVGHLVGLPAVDYRRQALRCPDRDHQKSRFCRSMEAFLFWAIFKPRCRRSPRPANRRGTGGAGDEALGGDDGVGSGRGASDRGGGTSGSGGTVRRSLTPPSVSRWSVSIATRLRLILKARLFSPPPAPPSLAPDSREEPAPIPRNTDARRDGFVSVPMAGVRYTRSAPTKSGNTSLRPGVAANDDKPIQPSIK